jgi:Uma2 family endonuclease
MATDPHYRLLTAEEFLQIEFGPDMKAELDNGVIRMMGGGTAEHDRIQVNIIGFLFNALKGSGCRPSGSDMGVRTHNGSVRYPDVTVFCRPGDPGDDKRKAFDDPRVIFEVLSPSTASLDRIFKVEEYKALASVDTIVLVDPAKQRVRVVQRTGPGSDGWSDVNYSQPQDVTLPSLGVTIPHGDIFAR